MLITAAAILVAVAEAYAAENATNRSAVFRRTATALREAKAQADDAAKKALAELEQVQAQAAEQLDAYRANNDQAEIAARAQLEEVRSAAAKAVAEAQEAAEAAIQQGAAQRDRILADHAADLRQQIEQIKADAYAQVKAVQEQADAAQAEAEQQIKALRDELADATITQQPAQEGPATARSPNLSGGHGPKMTPALIAKAQRMYDSGRHTVAEIAESCGVSPTTIYRHIDTDHNKTH